jgi:hypothetical protein
MTPDVRDVYDLLELEGVLLHYEDIDTARQHFSDQAGNGNGGRSGGRVSFLSALPPGLPDPAKSPTVPYSLDVALERLILEDPLYTLAELQSRLMVIGMPPVGRWTILRKLWRRRLLFRFQRFRYYRARARG